MFNPRKNQRFIKTSGFRTISIPGGGSSPSSRISSTRRWGAFGQIQTAKFNHFFKSYFWSNAYELHMQMQAYPGF